MFLEYLSIRNNFVNFLLYKVNNDFFLDFFSFYDTGILISIEFNLLDCVGSFNLNIFGSNGFYLDWVLYLWQQFYSIFRRDRSMSLNINFALSGSISFYSLFWLTQWISSKLCPNSEFLNFSFWLFHD